MIRQFFFLFLSLTFFIQFSAAQDKHPAYEKAVELYDKKDFLNAVKQVNLALQKDSTNADYLMLKGSIFQAMEQIEQAFEIYSKAIFYNPDSVWLYNNRGLLLASMREEKLALRDFDKALSLKIADSVRLSLLLNRGAVKNNIRDFKGAYEDLMEGYRIDSLNISILNNLATIADEVGMGDQTLTYLYKVIKINPAFAGAYVNIGFKLQLMEKHKEAVTYFDKALELEPDEPLSYNNRGYSKLKLGDLDGAMKDVNKSIDLYPGNSYAYRNKALIYIARNDMKAACQQIEKSLQQGFTEMYGEEVEELRKKHCRDIL
jgi:tetratricopeptide (TPR) repeat protein